MTQLNRRHFLKLSAGAAAASSLTLPHFAHAGTQKVVIIGGGVGGATAARYLKIADPAVEVILVEPKKTYHTCFMSNEVLSGERKMESISFGYDNIAKMGVKVIHSAAKAIDATKKVVTLVDESSVAYDRLIVSPGIDFKWEDLEGYDAEVAKKIPHAWQAGEQTKTLRKQLEEMKDGGTVIIGVTPPNNSFRCPPGPYERTGLIASYLKHHKPKSKVLVLDAKEKFSKQGLFVAGWKDRYGYGTDNSMIDWVPASKEGKIVAVNAADNTVVAGELEDSHKGDVINIIPPQKAGKIAFIAGLTDKTGWCPVNKKTFESTIHKDIYVIGDASIASKMPKSGYSANSQAKVCAVAVISSLKGTEMVVPSYVNTCYSAIDSDYGISVAAVYRYSDADNMIMPVKGAGGLSPADASAADRKREIGYAHSWFFNVTKDIFG